MILVARDTEGLRLVLAEMLERAHDLRRLGPQMEGKPQEHKDRLMESCTPVTLSPGYERWGRHIMLLERQHKLGVLSGGLLACEVEGLMVLDTVRGAHEYKHPKCGACGVPQESRFQIECLDCGVKFRGRSK